MSAGRYNFSMTEIKLLQTNLLKWYKDSKRELPWRTAKETSEDVNDLAYKVWVSEVMLQQTRVDTVIKYYNKWMNIWPSVTELSKASQEDVNKVWSGLGYYSRAERLRLGAVKVVNEMGGKFPETSNILMKEIPGVGRYTSCAVASIAYNEPVGIVDGNVIRVMTRLRAVGGDIKKKKVIDHIWKLANDVVNKDNPGDFNQGLMELGATVCTPQKPNCNICPVKNICTAYKQVNQIKQEFFKDSMKEECLDVEECHKFLDFHGSEQWDPRLGVTNYPRKSVKTASRNQMCAVAVVERIDKNEQVYLLLKKRPETGLLAGLWEFPTTELIDKTLNNDKKKANDVISNKGYVKIKTANDNELEKAIDNHSVVCRVFSGFINHIFSHINMTYAVEKITLSCSQMMKMKNYEWVKLDEVETIAISTSVRKILKLVQGKNTKAKRKSELNNHNISTKKKKLNTIDKFFKPK